MQPPFRKRRTRPGISKNELRSARHEQTAMANAKRLSDAYPQVLAIEVLQRVEMGTVTVEETQRRLGPADALHLDLPCAGNCADGRFLITDAVKTLLAASSEGREGMTECRSPSTRDPNIPCGTKLFYRIRITYVAPEVSSTDPQNRGGDGLAKPT